MANPEFITPDPSNLKLSEKSPSSPSTYWITLTNMNPGWTWIVLRKAGNLWLYYEWSAGGPAAQIYVWHQGGATTPINPGENNIQVGYQDAIMYQLTNPGSDMIKLEYHVT